ncbi:MAG: ABC transporter [Mesorhizobium amorphae]|nr:MAG: ABC transporter [Mesorhizobium amorphae]
MKIGVHPSNLHLRIASLLPGAFAALDGRFVSYPDGRQTAALLAQGDIHLGGTGSTPPLQAEGEGHDVQYIAASAPRPANAAILVRRDGPVTELGRLAGARVTLVDGSFHNYLLARALEEVGLTLRDVTIGETPAAESLPALIEGRVDAWIAMSPRLEAVEDHPDLRVLTRCGTRIPNRSLFWTLAGSGLSGDDRFALAEELARIGTRIEAEKPDIAERLARAPGSEGDAATWAKVLAARDFSIHPADAAVLAEQREEADTLLRHGHFSAPVRTGEQKGNPGARA